MTATPTIVAFAPDLMDRSKLAAAGATVVGSLDALAAAAADASVVAIDVSRPGAVAVLGALAEARRGTHPRLIAFGPHVDSETLTAAKAAGCDAVMARSRFFRDLESSLRS